MLGEIYRKAKSEKRGDALLILAVALLLFLAASLPYLARGGIHTFINMDDDYYVYKNHWVLKGLTVEGVRWAFTTFDVSNWHPLTWLSHMADVTLFGTDAWKHHMTNILLHALNTSLLFLALHRMTAALWISSVVAALFGLHPLHVESVAWVSERKDVLSGLFFMLVLLTYERYVRRGGVRRYLLVLLFLAMGLMAKPMLVTVPFLLLLLDIWPLGRTFWAAPADGSEWRKTSYGRLLMEKVPLVAVSFASGVVTLAAQKAGEAVKPLEIIGFGQRLTNAAISYTAYIGKTLWPLSLSVYYPLSPGEIASWLMVSGALLVLVGVTVAVVRQQRRPYLLVGWLWYIGMLVPVIGLVQVGYQSMADRYTYLPLTGLFVMAAWGTQELLGKRWRLMAAGGILLLLAVLTVRQVGYWKDSATLFSRALATSRGNSLVHNNLGLALAQEGRVDEALSHYRAALSHDPNYPEAHFNLGIAMISHGTADEAVFHLEQALRLRPDMPSARAMLSFARRMQNRRVP